MVSLVSIAMDHQWRIYINPNYVELVQRREDRRGADP